MGPLCWLKALKIGQTVSENKNSNFFFRGNLSTLKFTFWEYVFWWTYRLLYDLYLNKKKSVRSVDFKVQYWRERPGRQNGKFSLVPSLNFIFPAGKLLAVINEYYNTQILHFRVGLAYISKSLHLTVDLVLSRTLKSVCWKSPRL